MCSLVSRVPREKYAWMLDFRSARARWMPSQARTGPFERHRKMSGVSDLARPRAFTEADLSRKLPPTTKAWADWSAKLAIAFNSSVRHRC